jgi:hypothetical protein
MSESLAYVKEVFEEDLHFFVSKKSDTKNQTQSNSDTILRYPKRVPSPENISSYSPHLFCPALVVLLNVIACRFLLILRKQIYLAQVLDRRSEMESEDVSVQIVPGKSIKRVYTFPRDAPKSSASDIRVFRPNEMWELMQNEIIGLLRVQLQGAITKTVETPEENGEVLKVSFLF